jgi:tungstate transport system ATP-binding protein
MAAAGGEVLRLEQVSVRFGAVQALHEVDLSIHVGERVALIGANGCGKTTLLRALHGVVAHSGRRSIGSPDARAPVQSMVHQRPFMLRLSVLNNLRLALWLARVPRVHWTERTREALQRVGLAALEDRPARALSGGQQQRLALARAWIVRPDILFLDEPTSSLDPHAKREIEALLAEFAAEATTVVMSTHNLGQVKRLASRVVYLEQGRIRADQPTARFFAAHVHGDSVASFLKGELTWESV